MLVRALYAYSATSSSDLSIRAAERLDLIEGSFNSDTGACRGECGWVRVATLDGRREGFVPASYVVLDNHHGNGDDSDGDNDSQRGLLEAEQEVEQVRLEAKQAQQAQAKLAFKARETATEAAATAAAAVKAAEVAAAQADVLERAIAFATGPPAASEATEARDGYDSGGGSSPRSAPAAAAAPASAAAAPAAAAAASTARLPQTWPPSETPLGPLGPVSARHGPTPVRHPSASGDLSTCGPPAEQRRAEEVKDEGEGEGGDRRWPYAMLGSESHCKRRKMGWTDEEDRLIRTSVRKLGTQWPRIANQLPGRTADAVHETPPKPPPHTAHLYALERDAGGRSEIGGIAFKRCETHGQRGDLILATITTRESYLPAGWRPWTREGICTSLTPRRVRLSGRGRLRSPTSQVTTAWGRSRHSRRRCSVCKSSARRALVRGTRSLSSIVGSRLR